MLRRTPSGILLAFTSCVAIPVVLAPGGAPAGASPSAAVVQCMNGGWQTLTDPAGEPFENQGQCINFAVHHAVGLSDLAGSISGTVSAVAGTNGCSIVDATFSATYPGSSAVGIVTLNMNGCIPLVFPPTPAPFAGTFTLATSVGTVSGTAAGPITNVSLSSGIWPATAALTLTATSGTGLFTGTTGTLSLSLQWPDPGSLAFAGAMNTV